MDGKGYGVGVAGSMAGIVNAVVTMIYLMRHGQPAKESCLDEDGPLKFHECDFVGD